MKKGTISLPKPNFQRPTKPKAIKRGPEEINISINGIMVEGMESKTIKRIHFCTMEFLESINRQPKTAQDRKLIEQMLEMEFVLQIDQDGYIYKDDKIVACTESVV